MGLFSSALRPLRGGAFLRHAQGQLAVLDEGTDPEAVVDLREAERSDLAAALRRMRTYARGSGESPTKHELELERGGFIGIHATESAVAVHLGEDRAELALTFVFLSPYDAGVLAKELEGDRANALERLPEPPAGTGPTCMECERRPSSVVVEVVGHSKPGPMCAKCARETRERAEADPYRRWEVREAPLEP